MTTTMLNQTVTDFELPATTGTTFKLSNYQGKTLIVYFYPKDNTPGCTMEAQSFTQLKGEFEALGINIIGVSADNEASHRKFHESCGLGIDLISDTTKSLHNKFEVIGEKKNYGKIYVGTIRSTFLVSDKGIILKAWRNVKVNGHAEKVLREVKG